ncbi:hypothetical protein JB92DRAFT_3164707 [Gautieria morchelliformis]|nr:hypothetical protein JB92DRAFT_3164707 [Gautieria morchelliformis]
MYLKVSDLPISPVSSPGATKGCDSMRGLTWSSVADSSGQPGSHDACGLWLKTFVPYHERISTAKMMLSWGRGGENMYRWPCYTDNWLYADYEIPDAFVSLYVEQPQCPCTTQETEPDVKHYYDIWVVENGPYKGKVAAGCAQRDEGYLIQENLDMPAQVYARRPEGDLGPDIGFYARYIAHSTKKDSGMSQSPVYLPASPDNPFVPRVPSDAPSKEVTALTTSATMPPPNPNARQKALGPRSDMDSYIPRNNLLDIAATRHSECAPTMPGNRLVGETACLWEPPDASMLLVYNRDIPPLCGPELEEVVARLRSNEGVDAVTFWKAFDQCNCTRFFRKEALHSVHGPNCAMWIYGNRLWKNTWLCRSSALGIPPEPGLYGTSKTLANSTYILRKWLECCPGAKGGPSRWVELFFCVSDAKHQIPSAEQNIPSFGFQPNSYSHVKWLVLLSSSMQMVTGLHQVVSPASASRMGSTTRTITLNAVRHSCFKCPWLNQPSGCIYVAILLENHQFLTMNLTGQALDLPQTSRRTRGFRLVYPSPAPYQVPQTRVRHRLRSPELQMNLDDVFEIQRDLNKDNHRWLVPYEPRRGYADSGVGGSQGPTTLSNLFRAWDSSTGVRDAPFLYVLGRNITRGQLQRTFAPAAFWLHQPYRPLNRLDSESYNESDDGVYTDSDSTTTMGLEKTVTAVAGGSSEKILAVDSDLLAWGQSSPEHRQRRGE